MINANATTTPTATNENAERTWVLVDQTFTRYPDYLEARDLRIREFFKCFGITEVELGPLQRAPEWATPENYDHEPLWPVAAVGSEVLDGLHKTISAAELNACDPPCYLIPGILEAGQLGGIYGPFKTLKTSIAADLSISLASGTPFLGRFPVTEPGRVLFISGESALSALRSVARRICNERGLSLDSLENFRIATELPALDKPSVEMTFRELIQREKPVCIVIDPLYLAMHNEHGRNLQHMGELLRPLARICESTGCTILFVHHTKKSQKVGRPATLDDISGTGFAEFSAQWLTVSRRRAYEPDSGHHELWLSAAGRAGHNGLWALDVEEGASPPVPDEGPIAFPSAEERTWKTTLRSFAWAEAQADEQWVAAKENRRLRRGALAMQRQCGRTLEYLAANPNGANATTIREVLGINGQRMSRILDLLVDQELVIKTEDRENRRPVITYTRAPKADFSTISIDAGKVGRPDEMIYNLQSGQFETNQQAVPKKRQPCNAGLIEQAKTLLAQAAANATAGETGQTSGPDTNAAAESKVQSPRSKVEDEEASAGPDTNATAGPDTNAEPGPDTIAKPNPDTSSGADTAVASAGTAPKSGPDTNAESGPDTFADHVDWHDAASGI
jgi:RecA/RadA recombinase